MPQYLLDQCNKHHVALFTSPQPSPHVVDVIRLYLARVLAESTTLHGVFLDVLEMGVLITGASAIGKSELALELISRGNGLVADDIVELFRISPDTIEGRCPAVLRDFLEVRGIGILNIRTIFGETAVRPRKLLKLLVHLEDHSHEAFTELDRLQVNATYQDVLSVPDPQGDDSRRRRPQPRGAGRGGRAQLRAQPARHRQHQGIHRAPAEADGRRRATDALATHPVDLLLIGGVSGSGKSVALAALEDSGYHAINNLPPSMLVDTAAEPRAQRPGARRRRARRQDRARIARTSPRRSRGQGARDGPCASSTSTPRPIRWSSASRRRAAAIRSRSDERTLTEAIDHERALLAPMREQGFVFDTSDLSAAALRGWIKDFIAVDPSKLTLLFESFGFKHGVPLDADLVFDVRCLPNPHYEEALAPLDRHATPPVIEFPRGAPEVERMYSDIYHFVAQLAAGLCARQSQLPDRRDRLHRRPAPLGVSRRAPGQGVRRALPGAGPASRARLNDAMRIARRSRRAP